MAIAEYGGDSGRRGQWSRERVVRTFKTLEVFGFSSKWHGKVAIKRLVAYNINFIRLFRAKLRSHGVTTPEENSLSFYMGEVYPL